ncbi:MAG: alpha-amylase family glycosyl hydrolase [Planctomycetota bacterium]|nr:alpha-amylase family glycosyl hydrolase [Planctomycetota bacterium]
MNTQKLRKRLALRLRLLYQDRADECLDKMMSRIEAAAVDDARELLDADAAIWDQRDVVLITYGDQVRFDVDDGNVSRANKTQKSPLDALARFLAEAGLDGSINTVHLLPCFPYSSDDGFSVIDYRKIDPALGDWSDVDRLGRDYRLMFDLVLNHISRRSRWFEEYLAGREPFKRFFIEVDARADTSMVVRPRSLPLLTEVETAAGRRHVWTTFSDDQIDLNYAEPDVLVEMVDVLLLYLAHGARIVRLDAIAYLWKQLGTPCIHLPETHEVVKLLRDVADAVSPGTIILTETNVPHEENVSYFGDGDEAQMVYQFSLAPLLLEALLSGDGRLLVDWLAEMRPTPPGTTVFNFTASHDGIGVRPLEGIMPAERFERLLEAVKDRGGYVSTKRGSDGADTPYELNITYFSALADPDEPDPDRAKQTQIARFLASQAIMLSLQGIPGIYFHSLVGTPNDTAGVAASGRARSINRRKFGLGELREILSDEGKGDWLNLPEGCEAQIVPVPFSRSPRVLPAYRRLLEIRIAQPAFHPDATQETIDLDRPELVAFVRTATQQKILVIVNVSNMPQTVDLSAHAGSVEFKSGSDLLDDRGEGEQLELQPYQVAWLSTVARASCP